MMSLGASDFGLLVEGAGGVIENFMRRRARRGGSDAPAKESMRESAVEVARPMVFGGFIILVVYWPSFALQGMEARMFRPMALGVLALGHDDHAGDDFARPGFGHGPMAKRRPYVHRRHIRHAHGDAGFGREEHVAQITG